jgi:hypothetical protein
MKVTSEIFRRSEFDYGVLIRVDGAELFNRDPTMEAVFGESLPVYFTDEPYESADASLVLQILRALHQIKIIDYSESEEVTKEFPPE